MKGLLVELSPSEFDNQAAANQLQSHHLQYQLNPKIKTVWRISDTIILTITFFFIFLVGAIIYLASPESRDWSQWYCIICAVVYVVVLLLFLFVVTPVRHLRWRYELSPEFLEIENGILWRKHVVVPFIRVQNTDTKQGPILRAFGLSSVTISTAAGSMEIPGLSTPEADSVRDKAAEFARVAREDV